MLFTDGQPNIAPPRQRGYIESLQILVNEFVSMKNVQVHTFGFGTDMDAKLLYEIANFTQGNILAS